MSWNIRITGASGYLDGTLSARLATVKETFPAYGNLYALVRTEAQAASVKQYGANPFTLDTRNGARVRDNMVKIGYRCINFIKALGEIGKRSGWAVHLLHARNIPLPLNAFLINHRPREPSCTFTAVHGKEIGWEPEFPPEHILGAADAEVGLTLKNM
ncbi:hypothetical protein K438DRAFT_1821978 [Mycena galopus ATCC 62051]|nr:hypothetical protein K438DRAFT_1821978 [Mycena galopus ATCC 62051]